MLAGLIFATEDADDRPDTLAATLPFGGMSLVEYQARLLIAAGAQHILVAVSRVTPALLGAVSRIKRRGVTVDMVRSAQEAAAKAHPLAEVVVFADSLVTTDEVTARMAGASSDTLLITEDDGSAPAVERIDAAHCWAGIAKIGAGRLGEIAAMPREYDFQSTLLRIAVQSGARQMRLPADAAKSGHGIERAGAALATRSNAVIAALAGQRRGWADRFFFTPISRLLLPRLVARGVPDWSLIAGGVVVAAGVLAGIALGHVRYAFPVALVAAALFSTGALLASLRGEDRRARLHDAAVPALAGVVVLAAGAAISSSVALPTAMILALALVAFAAMAERVPAPSRVWHGTPAAYLLLLAVPVVAGYPIAGLAAVAAYAAATLAAKIESLRQKA
ncbi:hypothetical protein [Sphingomonas sp. AX6]|uniref:hypothetical protein n=1 Tax=Sphingomonas sp. AX6 TaxID=2653171 RepID=UPI0012EFE978|nr:hypothetical protein [Sphingomonas sp. AX6]VXC93313.1 conserved membrane hypothetical protein [Sphingomonas sp. AX6]